MRTTHLRTLTLLAAACLAVPGCDALDKVTGKNPASPTPAVSLDALAGTWVTSRSALPATSCGAVQYTVTPVSATTANITFKATCAGTVQVNGSGTGKINGSALEWSAQGAVTQGTLTCPFTFANGKATEDPDGVKIVYSGTVCGIPVSGEEVLKKP